MNDPQGFDEKGESELPVALVEINHARAIDLAGELHPELRLMLERRVTPRLKCRIDIDVVLQEAFLRLRESLVSRNPGSDEVLRAWIIRSVLNAWHDQRRWHEAQCRDVRREAPLPDSSVMLLLGGIGVGTDFGLKETVDQIRAAIKPEAFEIVWMHAVDGLSHKEIAHVVGKTEAAVGRYYLRALEKIQMAVTSPFTSSS